MGDTKKKNDKLDVKEDIFLILICVKIWKIN